MRPEGISENATWWWICDDCQHEFEDDGEDPNSCPVCSGQIGIVVRMSLLVILEEE
jgi:rRNA maturation endonuclease Nob1